MTSRGTRARSTALRASSRAPPKRRRIRPTRPATRRRPVRSMPASARASSPRVHELPQQHPRLERAGPTAASSSSARARRDNHEQETTFHPDRVALRGGTGRSRRTPTRSSPRGRSPPAASGPTRTAQRTPPSSRSTRTSPTGCCRTSASPAATASSWIDAYGENFGRDDMYVDIRGGMYDVFKARAYTNWLPHNFLPTA